MTTRRWMLVVLAMAVALGMGAAAVRTDREGADAYHRHALSDGIGGTSGTFDLMGSVQITSAGSIKTTGRLRPGPGVVERGTIYHRTPWLSRYWRHVLGRRGSDGYACRGRGHDPSRPGPGDRPLTADLARYRREYIILHGTLVGGDGMEITSESMMSR